MNTKSIFKEIIKSLTYKDIVSISFTILYNAHFIERLIISPLWFSNKKTHRAYST